MSWLPGFQPGIDAEVLLAGEDERKVVEVKGDKPERKETCPVYYDGESVKGQVRLGQHDLHVHLESSMTTNCVLMMMMIELIRNCLPRL